MFGLIFAREVNNLSQEELAKRQNVTRQSIFLWEKEGKIPEKRLKELSCILAIPEEYLVKDLTEIDKLKIERFVLEKKLEESSVEIDEVITEDGGNELSYKQTIYDNSIIDLIDKLDRKIEKLELTERIYKEIDNNEVSFYIYKSILDIIGNKKVSKNVVIQIVNAIKLAYQGKDSENDKVSGMIDIIIALEKDSHEKANQQNKEKEMLDDFFGKV